MPQETILIADDDASIRELARMYLEKDGYGVVTAVNGRQALDKIKETNPALLVLDLMMPEMDGWEVCRRVRAEGHLPILMLTARDDDIDKIVGLEMGADDYLTKPFNPRELVARVRAILRRGGGTAVSAPTSKARQLGNVSIDPASREVTVAGERINLRTKEFDLLLTLFEHVNIVLSRDQLLDLVWGYEFYGQTRTVDVHIAHLRDKLGGSSLSIETVWGLGYKLMAE
ncbi:MAG: response regulator transcription factor [Ardenticatenaceae bacterium]|nr:response regulator transcription factor [Ardenticatenaceae bacterium]MCB9442855.1 response regulator transcription factor [Ardenticatenaceae bacterium]